ncbi:unnamed protein product [Cuscuta epithymum]|uniref:Uncharacterized protein n=1 Tax=Cuscuta epithymum TaxID=186058 RepID=A0AAV0FGC7_9ASTE|nr:unnamed protein product [Cuscuta epithymum]
MPVGQRRYSTHKEDEAIPPEVTSTLVHPQRRRGHTTGSDGEASPTATKETQIAWQENLIVS